MPSPRETRAALQLLTAKAIRASQGLYGGLVGSPTERRFALLTDVPELIGYYSEGSAALASDFYEEERELAGVRDRFAPEIVIADRTVKTRRAVAWAAEPLFEAGDEAALAESLLLSTSRMAEVIQLDVARAFRDTITTNRQNDPQAVGWRRIANGGCGFCRMLADKGAVYRESTALFAAHTKCHCTAQPVFKANDPGDEASVMQYKASRRSRTPKQRQELRDYIAAYFPD